MSPGRPRRTIPRRAVVLGIGAVIGIAGCGPVRFGGPATYTPPPPGVDEDYRQDLLERVTRLAASDPDRFDVTPDADGTRGELLADLRVAAATQRSALHTGAEREESATPPDDGNDGAAEDEAPDAEGPADADALAELLVQVRDLSAQAARQVSASLTRVVLGIGAHAHFTLHRLQRLGMIEEVPPPPSAEDLTGEREVPDSDPPLVGAGVDYERSLEQTQEDEWYAGYAHEVLAASASGHQREVLVRRSEAGRTRAARLAEIAEEDSAPVVERRAVYPLPGGVVDDELLAELPTTIAETLLDAHLDLAAFAPFERRPLPITTTLRQAQILATLRADLAALPTIETEEG